jgi:uncharacterized protein YdaU (DUF1376 family)
VNYYEHHIGDYQRKTAHLTLAEHGAYMLMLQVFYATEKPLPENRQLLYRILRVNRAADRKAVDSVCDQFWQLTEGGITNQRAEEVLEKYRNWVEKQKLNGSLGGRPQKPKPNPSLTQGLSLGFEKQNPNETQTKPNGGYRARVPLPTSHLDLDTHTPSEAAPNGAARVGVKSKSGWKPPKTADDYEREEAARRDDESVRNSHEAQSHGGRRAG